jgi:hypothetical protein
MLAEGLIERMIPPAAYPAAIRAVPQAAAVRPVEPSVESGEAPGIFLG